MLLTGVPTLVVFLTTVVLLLIKILTMLLLLLVMMLKETGSSETHGVLIGVKMVTLD